MGAVNPRSADEQPGGAGPAGLRQRLSDRLSGVGELRARVEQLEADAAEARALSLRVAELTDLVAELVVPLARQDPERARALLEKYQAELGS